MMICAMGPPGGGKTFITPRFQRHFNLIAFAEVEDQVMKNIFNTILNWYFTTNGFNGDVIKNVDKIVAATAKIYQKI